jgi:hypothetical protein
MNMKDTINEITKVVDKDVLFKASASHLYLNYASPFIAERWLPSAMPTGECVSNA